MRYLSRLCVCLALFTLAGGPLLAAPLSLSSAPALSSPASTPSSPIVKGLTALGYGLAVFGAIKVKDTGTIAKKFVARAGAAQGDYKDGVASAGSDWETNALANSDVWGQATQEAISKGRFAKGVVGKASKFVKNATNLGPGRYAAGVANASDAYSQGVQPYLDTIKGLTLPPKGVRGSAQNQQRAQIVATELNKKRQGS